MSHVSGDEVRCGRQRFIIFHLLLSRSSFFSCCNLDYFLQQRLKMNAFFMKIALLTLMARHSGAVNSCITDTIATNLAGQSDIDLVGCGLGDADHEDLSDFFDNVGRLTIVNLDMSENDFESLPADLFKGMFIATRSSSMFINGNKLTTLLPDG